MNTIEETNKISKVCNDWNNWINSSQPYIKTDFEKNNMILILNTCNCCERHQVNKPKNLQKYIETNFKANDKSKYNCQCQCRHIARFICRSKYGFIEQ